MKFGVPSQRITKKEELFPNTPVLTIGIDGGKGTAKSMLLNEKAVELLKLGDASTVAFSFEEGVFITNGNHPAIPEEYRLRVTKGTPKKVSEKRTYTYISEKAFTLDNSVENHFELVSTGGEDEGGPAVFQLIRIVENSLDGAVQAIDESKEETASFAFQEEVEVEAFGPTTVEEVITATNGPAE